MPVQLRWLAPPPPAEDAQPLGADLDLGAAARAFAQAADENILTLVVVGWSQAAWGLLREEPRLAGRSVTWVVSARDAAALEAAAAADPGEGRMDAAAVSEIAEVAQAFGVVGGVFSLAAMSVDGEVLTRLQMMRIDNFVRQTRSLERALRDLASLSRRLSREGGFRLAAGMKDRHSGAAAVCVAAGPSLDRSIDLLRGLVGRCVIICVDVAYRRLAAAGIPCDYVLNVDSHDLAVQRMRGDPLPGTTLVMPIDGHAQADTWFADTAYFVPAALAGPLFGGVGEDFSRGTNVGSATVGWAMHLGCREILLLGHDLSFPAAAAYSAFVPDHVEHGRQMLAKVGRLIPIPGNGGEEVMTDHAFKIACADLAALVRRARSRVTVYNYNRNLGCGALIDHTQALPEGWQPPPPPLPAAPPAPRAALVDGEGLVADLIGRVQALLAAWQAQRGAGADALTVIERIGADAALGYARDLLWPAATGHILLLARLAALRAGEPSVAQNQLAEAATDRLLAGWSGHLLERIRDPGTQAPPEPLPEAGLRFLLVLAPYAPRLRPDSFEAAVVPLLARERISLQLHLPGLEVPLPPSPEECIGVLCRCGPQARPADLVHLLCLCSLDGGRFAQVLAIARELGLLTGERVGAATLAPWLAAAAPGVVAAHDALLALLAGGPPPEDAELRTLLAWPPAHVPLILALLGVRPPDPRRVAVLERLVLEAALPLDDAIVAAVVALHPDPLRACAIFADRQAVTGPATALAIARRQLDIGNLAGARGQFAGVGRLGRCAEDRLVMEGGHLVQNGRIDELLAILGGWPDREAGYRVLYRILAGRMEPAQAIAALGSDPRANLDPATVGEVLSAYAARQEALPAPVAAAARTLLRAWLAEPRPFWDREQGEQTLHVLEHFAGLSA